MTSLLLLILLAGTNWKAGTIETHTYKLAETGVPGSSTYTLRGVLLDGKPVFEIEVLTHRKLVLGGQEGKLETTILTWVKPENFDLLDSRLTTTLNGAEASYLRSHHQGGKIEVGQKLRGSPFETRSVEAAGPVVEENTVLFYLARLPWAKGRTFEWQRYSAAQNRLVKNTAHLDQQENGVQKVVVETDIGPHSYYLRNGVVTRTEVAGTEQMALEK